MNKKISKHAMMIEYIASIKDLNYDLVKIDYLSRGIQI
jgi:hypothetical protein